MGLRRAIAWAAITMTRGPHADGQAASKKVPAARPRGLRSSCSSLAHEDHGVFARPRTFVLEDAVARRPEFEAVACTQLMPFAAFDEHQLAVQYPDQLPR